MPTTFHLMTENGKTNLIDCITANKQTIKPEKSPEMRQTAEIARKRGVKSLESLPNTTNRNKNAINPLNKRSMMFNTMKSLVVALILAPELVKIIVKK